VNAVHSGAVGSVFMNADPGCLRRDERLKQSLGHFRCDAQAGVGHGDLHDPAAAAARVDTVNFRV